MVRGESHRIGIIPAFAGSTRARSGEDGDEKEQDDRRARGHLAGGDRLGVLGHFFMPKIGGCV